MHDLGELRLERGARLVGKVTDPAGRPLAGARVRVAGDRRGGGGGAESDAQGAFALNLREGVYRVSAEAQGFVRTELEQVVVTEAQGGEVALALQRGGRLSGTVYQPDGAAQAGAQLFVYRGGERLGETRADEQGAYGLDGLAPGPVEVFVRSGDRGLSCRVPLQISAREQRQDFVLHEAARIEGRLTTPDGEPLAGLRVRAVELQGDVRRDAESDADGRFAVANLYPGVYRLEVLRRGQRPPSSRAAGPRSRAGRPRTYRAPRRPGQRSGRGPTGEPP
ncbi:MAG: carboxypeptidase-like regulatory domain-containing protein [Planctomycetota bacterium]